MIVFLFNGCTGNDVNNLISLMEKKSTDRPLTIGFGTPVDIECFDTESGKKINGAEALALFWKFCKEEMI